MKHRSSARPSSSATSRPHHHIWNVCSDCAYSAGAWEQSLYCPLVGSTVNWPQPLSASILSYSLLKHNSAVLINIKMFFQMTRVLLCSLGIKVFILGCVVVWHLLCLAHSLIISASLKCFLYINIQCGLICRSLETESSFPCWEEAVVLQLDIIILNLLSHFYSISDQ